MSQPPQILRIKRKRGQDPLQALILEDSQRAKRSKRHSPAPSKAQTQTPEARSWYFQLLETNDKVDVPDAEVLASVLAEAGSSAEKRQFVIPKSQTKEDTVIPHELSEMLDTFLNVDNTETSKRKRRGRASPAADAGATQALVDDYVFDVYKLTSTEPLTNDNYPSSSIGYIRFFDDEEYELMQSDDENIHTQIYSDDEDSNAESFYQNDYPEDEDAGTYSDTYEPLDDGDDDEDDDDDDNVGPVIIDSAEHAEGHAYLQSHVQADLIDQQFDNLYDDFFDENGANNVDFLDDGLDDEQFERQHFFDGDEHDEVAIHRDRVFGRLQRMINEADN